MNNHPFKALFHSPNFVKLWVSQALSQLTINFVNYTILVRIFEATQSTIAVSILWVAYSLPAFIFAPISGTIVDRFSRRKMMIATNLLQAVTVLMFLLIKTNDIWPLYLLVFMYSLLDQLYLPSQQSTIPAVATKELLSSANGIFLLTQQFSLLLGFGFGGLLVGLLGHNSTIIMAGIFLTIAAISVFLLPKDMSKVREANPNLREFFQDLKNGFHFLREHRTVSYPLMMIAFAQVFITIISVILPSYAKNVLGVNINFVAVSFVVPGALGAVLLTYLLPRFLKKRRKKVVIELGLILASLSLFVLSLLSHLGEFKYIIAVLIAVGMGTAIACIMVPSQTLLQEKTPSWFRGRVYASLNFLLIVTTVGPLILSAVVADLVGVATMIAIIATVILLGLIFVKKKGDHVLANGFGI